MSFTEISASRSDLTTMAEQVDFPPQSRTGRRLVRLLFLIWILYFIAGLIIRRMWGEPYPGFFMPSFAGMGLTRMADTEGETQVCRVTVTFKDQTTEELSLGQFCGSAFFPESIMSRIFPSDRKVISADTTRYLETRARILFPQKTSQSVTFSLYRESFSLQNPQTTKTIGMIGRRIIGFAHEDTH